MNGDMLNVTEQPDTSMTNTDTSTDTKTTLRPSHAWQVKAKEIKTGVVLFDPSLPTNVVLLALLEKYAAVEGFDNTIARVILANQRED